LLRGNNRRFLWQEELTGKLFGNSRQVVQRFKGKVCRAGFNDDNLGIGGIHKAGSNGIDAGLLNNANGANVARSVLLGGLGNQGNVVIAALGKLVLEGVDVLYLCILATLCHCRKQLAAQRLVHFSIACTRHMDGELFGGFLRKAQGKPKGCRKCDFSELCYHCFSPFGMNIEILKFFHPCYRVSDNQYALYKTIPTIAMLSLASL